VAALPEQFEIKRAERRQSRLRLALAATSDGGKTTSGLLLARGIVEEALARGLLKGTLEGKIGVVDTERQSAQLYSHLVPFDVIELPKPYTVARYGAAMDALERAGCFVIMLDSISHAWVGDGGVLALLNKVEDHKRFSAFNTMVNPAQDEFVDRMLRSPCHVIATMRSKTAWVIEQVEKKKRDGSVYTTNAPRRIGVKPIQRDGIEFEFTTLLDLESGTHHAHVVKNRCTVFEGWQPQKLTVETGRALFSWLQEGAPAPEEPAGGTPEERARAVCDAAMRAMERVTTLPDLARALGDGDAAVKAFLGAVSVDVVAGMRAELSAAKDARKAVLGGERVPTGAGDRLEPELVAALEQLLQQGQVDLADLLAALQVPALRTLDPERLQEAVRWIWNKTDLDLFMPAALMSRGITFRDSHFEDLEDDIPF
jgi:hypothetical protein